MVPGTPNFYPMVNPIQVVWLTVNHKSCIIHRESTKKLMSSKFLSLICFPFIIWTCRPNEIWSIFGQILVTSCRILFKNRRRFISRDEITRRRLTTHSSRRSKILPTYNSDEGGSLWSRTSKVSVKTNKFTKFFRFLELVDQRS